MTTASEALAKVRRALELGSTIEDSEADEALALLPIIEGAMVPDLPEGIDLFSIEATVHKLEKTKDGLESKFYDAIRSTPNAAILAAIEKVKA